MEMREIDLDLKSFLCGYCVSTVALCIEHHGGTWYETYIFPASRLRGKITDWGEVWGVRYVTRQEAIEGHERVRQDLAMGRLVIYGERRPRRWLRRAQGAFLHWGGIE